MPSVQAPRSAPAVPLKDEIAAIEQLLAEAGPAAPAAGERIRAARLRWPGELRPRLLEGGWLEAAGQEAAAADAYAAACAAHPASPWPAVRLVDLLLRLRRPEPARLWFRDRVWASQVPERTRLRLLSQTTATLHDMTAREAYLRSLLRQDAEDRFPLAKLAMLRFRQKDRAGAEALFAEAAALGPITDEALQVQLELHVAAGRFAEAFALAQDLQSRHPDRVEYARRAIQAALFLHRTEEAVALLEAALRRWPGDWLLLFRYNRCPLPGAADRALFAALSARCDAMAGQDRWLFQHALASLRHEAAGTAVARVRSLAGSAAIGHMAGPLDAALAAQPLACWSNPRAVSNACDDEVQLFRQPGAVATVILFSSVAGGLGYLPFGMADGLLRQRPVHVLYLRDRNHRGFTGGVRALGPDHAAMAAALRQMTQPLGVPVITMGSSIAGVAAIRAAAAMPARAAISFAGPVHLGQDTTEEDAAPAGAAGGTRASLFSHFSGDEADMVALLRAHPGLTVHQCFGTGFEPDVAAAQLLAPLPNAVLHPEPGCADHFAIEHAIASGRFFTILDAALAGAAP
ncbi:lipopolysaccharide assembly protein LapB [Pseudoroseomonas cervicalis]|uniref:tetratricopeptide repeat protein n=1 Tax=Teichococcus cervicalis TaxID=204525 RepID=UPI0022F1D85E|nr:hypothetical protein [Pseudoroseomonas cervicalis]WBV44041.1 hypothetical protein PFY06_05595 [Pseudoroseomonas cervicalis]